MQLRWKPLGLALLLLLVDGDVLRILAQGAAQPPGNAGKTQPKAKEEPSLLLTEPKTPDEMFKAAVLMYRLARPNLARKYLKQLMDSKPSDKTLLQLRDKYGPADFLRLALAKDLQPLSRQLLDRVNAAFRARGADPKYISGLLDKLEGTDAERFVAITTLRNTGPIVLPRIFERIATSADAKRILALQEALVDFGKPAIPALIGALESNSVRVRTVALSTLGAVGSKSEAPHLWPFAFNRNVHPAVRMTSREALGKLFGVKPAQVAATAPGSVARELATIAKQHFRGEHVWKPGADKKVELWTWQAGPGPPTLSTRRVTPRFASLYFGARFARQALELTPTNRDVQSLYVALSLAAAADPTWKKPLPTGKGTAYNAALAAGSQVVNAALDLALKHGDANAAIGALVVLRQLATKNDLAKGKRSPIVAAMRYPDIRVQFTAATTVLNVDPDAGFSGITRVVDVLARSLSDSGSPTSLVVNTNLQRASSLAGLLSEMGYDPQVARTGRDSYKIATRRADIELILLQLNTIRWPLSQTLANLRADGRTKGIPIIIYGPPELEHRVQRHLKRYSRVAYIVDSTTSENLAIQVKPFLATIKTVPLSPQQRAEQRSAAAFWLAHIADGKRSRIYDLRPAEPSLTAAANDPRLASDAVTALAAIPTKGAQQTFHRVLTTPNADIKVRRLAASLLATHIQQFGLLLTNKQVTDVKNLHAAATDAELTTALAAVLGTLKPDGKRVGERLKTVPLPRLPNTK
ncbi:MAG: hypothetical protein ACE5KM_18615 [Planctomycetaceae bacterium]